MLLAFYLVGTVVRVFANGEAVHQGGGSVRFVGVPGFSHFHFHYANRAQRFVVRARVILWDSNDGDLNDDFRLRTFFNLGDLVWAIEVAATFRGASYLFIGGLGLSISCGVFIVLFRRDVDLRRLISDICTFELSDMVYRRFVFLNRFFFFYRVYLVFRDERLKDGVERGRWDEVYHVSYGRIGAFINRVCTILLFVGCRVR